MNYLKFLNEQDIILMLEKCNLKFDTSTDEPLRFSERGATCLVFCQKIKEDEIDQIKNVFLEKFKLKFSTSRFNEQLKYFANNIILLMTSFELYDSFNDVDLTNVLFETFCEKFKDNEKLAKKYKKDFIKHYEKVEKHRNKTEIHNDKYNI